MTELVLIVLIILVSIVLTRINSTLRGVEALQKKIDRLNQQFNELSKKIDTPVEQTTQTFAPEEIKPKAQPVVAVVTEIESPSVKPPVIQPKPPEEIKAVFLKQEEPVVAPSPLIHEERIHEQEPSLNWFDRWLESNPDMEKFIGENLVNKIGIAVLVLGIGFFVKYAIDKEWINETGRVGIGILCGGILIGIAHRMRNNYKAFSSVLIGGGLAVFYFTIAFAFHQYHLIGQQAAFIIMVTITAFAVALSVAYNKIEIAILATVGGFLTPFMVSTGNGNYIVLFTYLGILNAGLIALAFYKKWRVLNFISFLFTTFIYAGWIIDQSGANDFSYSGTFLFGILFYLMFLMMNIIHHAGRGSRLNAFDFSLLLSVNFSCYVTGMYLLDEWAPAFKGLFTGCLGLLNLVLAFVFYRNKNIDRNFVYLLIGVTLTYVSLIAPVQLNGNYITLFWAAEMVVLFWLYQKSRIQLVKIASACITVLMLLSLLSDWISIYAPMLSVSKYTMPVIINKGFITTIVSAAAMGILFRLLQVEADSFYLPRITNNDVRKFYQVTVVVLLFMAGVLEIQYQFTHRFPSTGLQYVFLQLYTVSFFILLFYIATRIKLNINGNTRIGITSLLLLVYLINTGNVYTTEKLLLTSGNYKTWFSAQWISFLVMLLFAYQFIFFIRNHLALFAKMFDKIAWVTAVATIVLFSVEIRHIYVWITFENPSSLSYAENLFSKAGLSIIWGLFSFALIWLGLHYRYKVFRIIALILFGITLIKLFAYDISNIPPAGKIAAFILLGVLLLVISFMYQRIKKLIIDDKGEK